LPNSNFIKRIKYSRFEKIKDDKDN